MTRGVFSRVLLVATGVFVMVVAVVAAGQPSAVLTTYAAGSAAANVAFFIAGLALIAAGGLAAGDRAAGPLWSLCVLGGIAWLSPAWVGWDTGPALPRSVGMVLAPFLVPVLVHLLLAAPGRRLSGPLRRTVVAGVYGITAAASIGLALTRNPFLDPNCWSNCADNVFRLVSDPGLARLIEAIRLSASVGIGILAVLVATWQLLTSTPVARAVGWMVTAPAALAITAEVCYAAVLRGDPAESPERNPFVWIFFARSAALTALAVGVTWYVVQRRRRRTAFLTLVNELEMSPGIGSLQALLSRSLGDNSLTVAYWLSRAGRYVDALGHAVNPEVDQDRAMTAIVRSGTQVAVVSHERAILDDQTLRQRIGPAALLAIDNERLGVELTAHLQELRLSRMRIVTAADEARRQIERDLHDGAQQRLLSVLYELRLASSESQEDAHLSGALDALIEGTQKSLVELRELAQGIFPAILDEAGLGAALGTLADQAGCAIEIRSVPHVRLPAPVERTAYLVVSETVGAAHAGSGGLTVNMDLCDETLTVCVDGADKAPSEYLADRVGAAGGVLSVNSGAIRAEIPCG